ncbi:MAG: AmmeMemoRadiSam system protein A [Patescibacteria group bacterium]
MFTLEEKKFILTLARLAIAHYFESGKLPKISLTEVPGKTLLKDGACFVTLTIAGALRGCVGHLEAIQPLYLDIMKNAVAAAFEDTRFFPLQSEELAQTDIEVSILSESKPLSFLSPEDLLAKLQPGQDGVIIRRGNFSATYLPQVWEELPAKKDFLTSLCLKAGLAVDSWTKPGLEVSTYQVEVIK